MLSGLKETEEFLKEWSFLCQEAGMKIHFKELTGFQLDDNFEESTATNFRRILRYFQFEQQDKLFINVDDAAIGADVDTTKLPLTPCIVVCGNTNYDKSKFKLLFVLDGLDESRLQLNFASDQSPIIDVTQSVEVEVLLTSLIKGELLPSARLWITTWPAAANQIPLDFVDIMTEVRGFTDLQKEEYFRKRFRDEQMVNRIISHIKTSRSLHIMCHIYVFCWITATVLEDVLKSSEREVQRMAIEKTLRSPDGHLDLFLRFLLGLSLETNQKRLQGLL
ncbi:hypothetical protein PAMA_009014 [Pampus argenteus]